MSYPPAAELAGVCREVIRLWHRREPPLDWSVVSESLLTPGPTWAHATARLCLINCFQWHLEDDCRAHYADSERLAALKRGIDASNARRVACIDALDERLMDELGDRDGDGTEPVVAITPGALLDRISILALKREHAAGRRDVATMLDEQIEDACLAVDRVISDLVSARQRMKRYGTLKFYGPAE